MDYAGVCGITLRVAGHTMVEIELEANSKNNFRQLNELVSC